MPYDPQVHHRRSIRLKGYDYASAGAYFVTFCTHERQSLLGQVNEGEMHLSAYGVIVRACWEDLPRHYPGLELDAFVHQNTASGWTRCCAKRGTGCAASCTVLTRPCSTPRWIPPWWPTTAQR